MGDKKSEITLDELLLIAEKQRKDFIKQIEREEDNERVEHIDAIINDIKAQKEQTKIHRDKFINEIKFGLGEQIKNNPNEIIIHKKPWYVKTKEWFKKIFTSF